MYCLPQGSFWRLAASLLLPASLLLASGCAPSGPSTAKVTGKVLLPNGQPLPGGRIDFYSSAGQYSGVIQADGAYEAPDVPFGPQTVAIVNAHLQGVQPPPGGLAPMPGGNQSYVPIDVKYATPQTSGLSMTVDDAEETYDVQL